MSTSTSIAVFLAILFTAANAVPYSKYGRTCKDIGCRSDEVCVMAEDPCNSYQRDSCGRYPTCQRNSNGESCTTKFCPSGTYCKTENGKPTCVSTNPNLPFDSAGVSAVNGQHLPGQPSVPADPNSGYGSRYASSNPYANANAPPAEDVNHNYNQPSYANNNPAYPPYPSNNNGYPPYPSNNNNNNNNGYPPYPNNNRPVTDRYGYPIYTSSTPRPGYYGNSAQHNIPQLNSGWNYQNYRRNGASQNVVSWLLIVVGSLLFSVLNFKLQKV